MFLTLAPFHASITGTNDYQSDPDLLKKQEKSALLRPLDQNLIVKVNVERHRTLPSTFSTPEHWATPMGLHNALKFPYNASIKKGDTNALCLMSGRVTKEMVRVHTDEYVHNRERSQANPSVQSEDPDQAIAYMMGMSYYERVSRFRGQLENLTQTSVISNFAHGFAKIGAQRNRDGPLINNGEINLVASQVDMFFRTTAVAGNGRLRADQTLPLIIPMTDFLALSLTDVSAQEHAIINEFFQQKEAASTVSLLHKSIETQGEIITLTQGDYQKKGDTRYTINGVTKSLKEWIGLGFWNMIISERAWGDFHLIYLTKGPQTLAGGDYTGVGAFTINPGGIGAPITSNLNGGYGQSLGSHTFRPQNYKNLIVKHNSSGSPYVTTTAPTPHNPGLPH